MLPEVEMDMTSGDKSARVTFISAMRVMTPDDDGPTVKFTFRIVAGPDWEQKGGR